MKKLLCFLTILLSCGISKGQEWKWAKLSTTEPFLDFGYYSNKIVLDAADNIYVTSNGIGGALVAKFDKHGNEEWRKAFTGKFKIAGIICLQNYVYLSGTLEDTLSAGLWSITALEHDGILIKLDSEGTIIWHQTVSGPGEQFFGNIATHDNKLFIIGSYADTTIIGNQTLNCECEAKMFLVKYDLNGNVLFTKSSTCPNWYYSRADGNKIAINADGEIYCYGLLNGFLIDTFTLQGSSGGYLTEYLFKLNSQGDVIWAKTLPNRNVVDPQDMVLDGDDNILISANGSYHGVPPSAGVAKYSAEGHLDFLEGIQKSEFNGVASHSSGYYVSGGIYPWNETAPSYFMLLKCDNSGSKIWWDTIPGSVGGTAIRRNSEGDFIVCGNMQGDLTLGFQTLSSQKRTFFIGKFKDAPPSTGLRETESSAISVYPVPSHDKVQVKLLQSGSSTLSVKNNFGQVLFSQTVLGNATAIELDLSAFSSGIYFLEIKTDQQRSVRKLVRN